MTKKELLLESINNYEQYFMTSDESSDLEREISLELIKYTRLGIKASEELRTLKLDAVKYLNNPRALCSYQAHTVIMNLIGDE